MPAASRRRCFLVPTYQSPKAIPSERAMSTLSPSSDTAFMRSIARFKGTYSMRGGFVTVEVLDFLQVEDLARRRCLRRAEASERH
jgi:hypothetical protein